MNTLYVILRDHLRYRKQILKLAKSDLVKTYKGAALGWSWAIIRPAIMIAVYDFAISVGLRHGSPVGEYPFFLWLISGMIPWFYISTVFTGGTVSIRKYSYLVNKVRYPVSTIPTFVSLSQLVVHAALVVIVMGIFMVSGKMPDLYWLQIPFFTLLMFLFFTAWSLFAGMLSIISKDFMQLVRASLSALFWLSGILYNANTIDIPLLRKILLFNPITIIVNGYRNAFIYKVWFWETPVEMRNFAIVFFVMAALAVWTYKRLIESIADVM